MWFYFNHFNLYILLEQNNFLNNNNLFIILTGKDYSGIDVIIADVKNVESLNAMCSQAKLVLNCVGPVCIIHKNFPREYMCDVVCLIITLS